MNGDLRMTDPTPITAGTEPGGLVGSASTDPQSRAPWRTALLAGMASYLDAGTIVAVSASLTLWKGQFSLDAWQLGFLSAALTVCIGIGAIVGGRIGDRVGRKRVYSFDLLLYAFGLLWIVCAVVPAMLFVGVIIVGLAVGADVPTSITVVGETAPGKRRGRLVTFTQLLWGLGPLVVILVVLASTGFGEWMPRIVFGHLLVLALITWALRRRIGEPTAWTNARTAGATREGVRALFRGRLLRSTLFILAFYALLTIGTNFYGSFGLYALETVGGLPPASALLVSLIGVPVILITVLAMMRAMDSAARRPIFIVGAIVQVAAWILPLVLPVGAGTLVIAFVTYGIGTTLAGEAHYKVWSQELFPTELRSTALGLSFGVARIASAVSLVFVPTLLAAGLAGVSVLMIVVTVGSGILGILFMPRTRGESIDEIDARLRAASLPGE
ncbi:minor myo-inositol transporter IolF [Leifsonia sp. LS1]|nr:minor myo-inositol transporter IolF [Leifsonia sp. LS1]